MKLTFEFPDIITLKIPHGKAIEIDVTKFAMFTHVLVYIFRYGLKKSLADSASADKTEAAAKKTYEARLDGFYAGKVPSQGRGNGVKGAAGGQIGTLARKILGSTFAKNGFAPKERNKQLEIGFAKLKKAGITDLLSDEAATSLATTIGKALVQRVHGKEADEATFKKPITDLQAAIKRIREQEEEEVEI